MSTAALCRRIVGLVLLSLIGARSSGITTAQSSAWHPHEQGHCMLQVKVASSRRGCGKSPSIGKEQVDEIIKSNRGALILAVPDMKCTAAAKTAFGKRGVAFKEINFDGNFQYTSGASPVWDWLHCTYPEDDQNGATMHSYVFIKEKFIGQGFEAAAKVGSGQFDEQLGGSGNRSCDDQYGAEAAVVGQYMSNTSTKVLLFGWIECPCTGIAQSRFASKSICYEGRTWANPSSKMMEYLQCREGDSSHHSFVYFNIGGDWVFKGNGFQFDESKLPGTELDSLVASSGAPTKCKQASVQTNLYGSPLEECRADSADMSGSWMDDGKCTETSGGVHQVCIEKLPADFSSETHQPAWSKERADKRHCVCIGAWSLYMTDAANHTAGAEGIMPHCSSIPETALTKHYLQHWKDWNGYPAEVQTGVKELVSRCLASAPNEAAKCGLKERFDKLQAEVQELRDAAELKALRSSFPQNCPAALLGTRSQSANTPKDFKRCT